MLSGEVVSIVCYLAGCVSSMSPTKNLSYRNYLIEFDTVNNESQKVNGRDFYEATGSNINQQVLYS